MENSVSEIKLQKKRRMRNARKKRKRQERTRLKHQAAEEEIARKTADGLLKEKEISKKYYLKWKRSVDELEKLKNKMNTRKVHYYHTYHAYEQLHTYIICETKYTQYSFFNY